MKIAYIPSAVKKPFSVIDQAIVSALKKMEHQLFWLKPGSLTKDWKRRPFDPRLVLAMLGERLGPEETAWIQDLPVPKAIWYTDDPYAIDSSLQTAGAFDLIFTNESQAVPLYKQKTRAQVFHLPLAAPLQLYYPEKTVPSGYRSDLALVGSAFQNRLQDVRKLSPFLFRYKTRLVGPGWYRLQHLPNISVRRGWVEADEVRRYYNGAKIVLNIHRSYDDPYLQKNTHQVKADTPNNRVFEIAACRAFQLVDERKDLGRLFQPGKEIITYRTLEELKEKIAFYLPRPHLCQKIAHRAFERTRKEHQYEHRLRQILKLVR
ncbi:glycosyltransferase [Thermoactinomyces sp. CICC 10522]|uniref:CgeB family protein n=1 Tax=Thermoactinomyces sp. CICC 10522 TaxID=2767427 RepID=UPI0018DBE64D|nr:glycosyltransferase [Thermoactinomyces sp. CICC 10522]